MKENNLTILSKVLLVLVGLLFIGSLFVPMWRIELNAPQYPEGLMLQLHANKIGGDVDIINGLNHYIGMATLHTENFFEFKILPYIFGAFALISLILVFLNCSKACLLSLCLSSFNFLFTSRKFIASPLLIQIGQ